MDGTFPRRSPIQSLKSRNSIRSIFFYSARRSPGLIRNQRMLLTRTGIHHRLGKKSKRKGRGGRKGFATDAVADLCVHCVLCVCLALERFIPAGSAQPVDNWHIVGPSALSDVAPAENRSSSRIRRRATDSSHPRRALRYRALVNTSRGLPGESQFSATDASGTTFVGR